MITSYLQILSYDRWSTRVFAGTEKHIDGIDPLNSQRYDEGVLDFWIEGFSCCCHPIVVATMFPITIVETAAILFMELISPLRTVLLYVMCLSNDVNNLTDIFAGNRENTSCIHPQLKHDKFKFSVGMSQVKGHIAKMAVCLEDSDERIAALAKLFFHELARKEFKVHPGLASNR